MDTTVNPEQALLEAGLLTIFHACHSWLVICTHGSLVLKNVGGWNSLLPFSKGEKPIEGSRWAKMAKDEAKVRSRVQAAQNTCVCHSSLVPSVSCLKDIKHLTNMSTGLLRLCGKSTRTLARTF